MMLSFGFELEIRPGGGSLSGRSGRRTLFGLLDRIAANVPASWDIIAVNAELIELRTAGSSKDVAFYTDDAKQWAHLVRHLGRLQSVVPMGFSNVHLHVGFPQLLNPLSDTEDRRRCVGRRLARTVKIFESLWRVASGRGFSKPEPSGTMELYSWNALHSNEEAFHHTRVINLSVRYPTLEVKTLGGLRDERGRLELENLAADVRWVFCLLKAITGRGRRTDLSSLGLPLLAGVVPSRKRIDHFCDLFLADSETARQRFLRRLHHATKAGSWRSRMRTPPASHFEALGLGEAYDLHRREDGVDLAIASSLLRRRTLSRLTADLLHSVCGDRSELCARVDDLLPPPVADAVRARVRC